MDPNTLRSSLRGIAIFQLANDTYYHYINNTSGMRHLPLTHTHTYSPVLNFQVQWLQDQRKDTCISICILTQIRKVGVMSQRSKEYQFMIECIGNPHNNENSPKINCKIYDEGIMQHWGICSQGMKNSNIIKIARLNGLISPTFMLSAIHISNAQTLAEMIKKSKWYQYLYLIIRGANSVAKDLLNGLDVVIHCSDGWDRTSQLCSLAQILLDPYYRTIQGVCVLIKKDWRCFGHKFRGLTCQYNPNKHCPNENSQIFIQFLDCIFQLMCQFPLSFEYNQNLLYFLGETVYECLWDIPYQLPPAMPIDSDPSKYYISLVIYNKTIFRSNYYVQGHPQKWLQVNCDVNSKVVWKNHFLGKHAQDLGKQEDNEINRDLKEQYQYYAIKKSK